MKHILIGLLLVLSVPVTPSIVAAVPAVQSAAVQLPWPLPAPPPDPAGTTIEVGSVWRNRYLSFGDTSLLAMIQSDQRPNIFTVVSFSNGHVAVRMASFKPDERNEAPTTWMLESEFRDGFRKILNPKPAESIR